MKKTDLAYAAGIVDGEGCISFCYSHKKYQALLVEVTNTNEWLVRWFSFVFGGRTYFQNDKRRVGPKYKPIFRWIIRSTEALEFLKLIYPYLMLKKTQADIAIKFLNMRGRKGRHFTAEERLIAEAQSILLRSLNKKGIKEAKN